MNWMKKIKILATIRYVSSDDKAYHTLTGSNQTHFPPLDFAYWTSPIGRYS